MSYFVDAMSEAAASAPVRKGQAPKVLWGDLALTAAIALGAVALMLAPPIRRLWLTSSGLADTQTPTRGGTK